MIEFVGLVKRFGEKRVLDGIDLRIAKGAVQFIIGTSGAGKSVLMKHVVGLVRADEGKVLFEGADITRYTEAEFFRVREKCGLVFQHSTLFDSMDIVENVALPLVKRRGLSERDARARASEVLESLHLSEWAQRLPSELGAGLRKRAAIARTLALEPEYVIYDEPTTGLDPVAARRVDAMILELKARGLTQIVVSHDLRSIFGVADRIAMIHRGKVHVEGTKDELARATDPVVVQFLGGAPEGPL
ncbi:ATP-binding cassette domain-containing protein [Myxococcota bacterium]|nr:ATP-binding cassette domain-containing protein [Myxococcota bacterium]